jgi:hypothetical protein
VGEELHVGSPISVTLANGDGQRAPFRLGFDRNAILFIERLNEPRYPLEKKRARAASVKNPLSKSLNRGLVTRIRGIPGHRKICGHKARPR